ncbi:hypothetical protein ABFS83_08G077800 [Erythranthe nasuta]
MALIFVMEIFLQQSPLFHEAIVVLNPNPFSATACTRRTKGRCRWRIPATKRRGREKVRRATRKNGGTCGTTGYLARIRNPIQSLPDLSFRLSHPIHGEFQQIDVVVLLHLLIGDFYAPF